MPKEIEVTKAALDDRHAICRIHKASITIVCGGHYTPEEIAAWISHIRLTECHLVHHRNRSVPLRAGYLDPSGKFSPFFRTRDIVLGQKTMLHPDTQHLFAQYENHTLGHRYRR